MTTVLFLKLFTKIVPLLQEIILGDRSLFGFLYDHALSILLLSIIIVLSFSLVSVKQELKLVNLEIRNQHLLPTIENEILFTPINPTPPFTPKIPKPNPVPLPSNPPAVDNKVIRSNNDTRNIIRDRLVEDL